MTTEASEPGYPKDLHDENLPEEAGSDLHLKDFSKEDRKLIQLMADIIVNSVLNS